MFFEARFQGAKTGKSAQAISTTYLRIPPADYRSRMKQVELYRWWIPDERRPGKVRLTGYAMTREQAAERFPGAQADEATREVRELPETPDEAGQLMHRGGRATP